MKQLRFNYKGVKFDFYVTDDDVIFQEVKNTGAWERHQLDVYEKIFQDCPKNRDKVFVDIGANVGINTLYVDSMPVDSKIYAIEPHPDNFKALKMNTEGRGIEIFPLAIADKEGEVFIVGSGGGARLSSAQGAKVKAVSLDSFYASQQLTHVDIIKIDVEGYNDVVMAESRKALACTDNCIVEICLPVLHERFGNDPNVIRDEVQKNIDIFKPTHPYCYFASKLCKLVAIDGIEELMDMINAEQGVSDLIFCKTKMDGTISAMGLVMYQVGCLMHENHLRVQDIARLQNHNHTFLRKWASKVRNSFRKLKG